MHERYKIPDNNQLKENYTQIPSILAYPTTPKIFDYKYKILKQYVIVKDINSKITL